MRGEPTAAEKFDRFLEFQDRVRPLREAEQERIQKHASDCFAPYECQSCGCDRRGVYVASKEPTACVSHMGNPAHQAYLTERLIHALERQAKS